jgi:hypothetical protein
LTVAAFANLSLTDQHQGNRARLSLVQKIPFRKSGNGLRP